MSEDITSENFPAERRVMRVAELVHRDARTALRDLWMALGGVAATEVPASGNETGNT